MELGILFFIVAIIIVGKLLIDRSKKATQMGKTYSNVTELQDYIDAV
jgi:hypothetical protein